MLHDVDAQQGVSRKGLLAPASISIAYGSMSETSSTRGTTSSMASTDSHLRVRLVGAHAQAALLRADIFSAAAPIAIT